VDLDILNDSDKHNHILDIIDFQQYQQFFNITSDNQPLKLRHPVDIFRIRWKPE
jgi:uncharacterized protein (DUF2249 family)